MKVQVARFVYIKYRVGFLGKMRCRGRNWYDRIGIIGRNLFTTWGAATVEPKMEIEAKPLFYEFLKETSDDFNMHA